MPVTCPYCRSAIPADDIELTTRLAKCRACDEVFPLEVPAAAPPVEHPPPIPVGVQVTDDGLTRTLEFRWFTPVAFFLLIFCVVWNGFLVFWYSVVVGGADGRDEFYWLGVLFPIGHVTVGLGLAYFTLSLFVNRTTVTVDHSLRVWHGPLFWPGGVTLPADGVTAVYCEQVIRRGKRGPVVSYAVKAVTADGRAVHLIGGLEELPRAKFFERKLEGWLGLPPTAVPGEAL